MSEQHFVQMLLAAADGEVNDERDRGLAAAAARWAHASGRWHPRPDGGYQLHRSGLATHVRALPGEHLLEIRVRVAQGYWRRHAGYPIAHLGHALDVLAVEELIPARYCTLGRNALEDLADTYDRSAHALWRMARTSDDQADGDSWQLRVRSSTLSHAADSARAFAGAPLAVLAS